MSLILDALRKSEAERRRGQAPDLFAPVAARVAPVARPRIVVLMIAIAAILVTSVIVFWPWPAAQEPAPDNNSPTAQNLPNVSATTDAITPAPAVQPKATLATPEISTTRKSVEVKPVTSKPVVEIPATAPNQTATVDSSPAVTPPITDAVDTNASDNEPALPTLATLDSTTRAALPPLQLSMHVWNQDATRRFAIIDGQRLGEGAKLGDVVIAGIRRDGVVLDIDGRQFLLPRP